MPLDLFSKAQRGLHADYTEKIIFNDNLSVFFHTSNKSVLEISRRNLHMKRLLCGLGSKVDKLLCFFPSCGPTLLHRNKLMTKSQREPLKIKIKSGGKRDRDFSFSKQRLLTARDETGLFFSVTSAIHSPYWAFLSDLSLFRHLSSSLHSVNDPGGLAGCEQKLVNQDLRREGEDPRHHAVFQTAVCVHVCVRSSGGLSAQVGLTQESVSEVA